MPFKLIAFLFTTPLGRLAGGALAVLALVASFAAHERGVGSKKAVDRQEKTNAELGKKADVAARKSIDPAARGVLNPHYRAD